VGEQRPSVYQYINYRSYLREVVDYLKSRNEYSNRAFAESAGLKSHVHLHLIITGKKNASRVTLKRIAKALDLGPRETDFLQLLAEFAHAPNSQESDEIYQQILSAQGFLKVNRAQALEYRYYSDWKMIATLEALSTPWGEWPAARQAESLGVTESQLETYFDTLSQIGLISRLGSRWVRKEGLLKTDAQAQNILVKNFHREMIKRGLDSLENGKSDQRNIVSITLPLSEKSYAELNTKLFEMLHEFANRYVDLKNSKAVYQLNFQVFPLLRTSRANEEAS